MGSREPDERPPIEILGADLGVSSTQQVAMGPRRKPGRRHRSLAIAGVVGVLLVGGFAIGGSDDGDGDADRVIEDERDNRARDDLASPLTSTTVGRTTTTGASATTTTTTLAPLGPLFGDPIEGVLLVVARGQWHAIDLETGALTEIDSPAPVDPYSAVAVGGGLVVPQAGTARFYRVIGGGTEPEAVELGPADQVGRAGPDRVWLFDQPPDGSTDPLTVARLVDLEGHVERTITVSGWQGIATDDGVLVSRGGRVYVADERGVHPLAIGWLNGRIGDAALLTACDDAARCELQRQPLDGGPARSLAPVEDPDRWYFDVSYAPDGRIALLRYEPLADAGIQVFGADGDDLGGLLLPGGTEGLPQWLPGDHGLVVKTLRGLGWIHREGGSWRIEEVLEDGILPFQAPGIEGLFVVTP